jgi:hypothetical protein
MERLYNGTPAQKSKVLFSCFILSLVRCDREIKSAKF